MLITGEPPDSINAGVGFGFTVEAEDFYGNLATGFEGTVTATLATNPTLTTLGGTVTATAFNGVAAFTNLLLNKPGNGYSLNVKGSSLSGDTTDTFDVIPGTAVSLVLLSEPPTTVTAGAGFDVTVAAEDAVGNISTSYGGVISLGWRRAPATTPWAAR